MTNNKINIWLQHNTIANRDFLAQFGEVDDWAINDDEFDPEKWKPVYFKVNELGRELGQRAIELEQQFKGQLIPEDKMLSLAKSYSDAVGIDFEQEE